MGHVAQEHPNLAVFPLPQTSAPLPLHSHRVRPFLGKGRGIEDEDAIVFPQFPE